MSTNFIGYLYSCCNVFTPKYLLLYLLYLCYTQVFFFLHWTKCVLSMVVWILGSSFVWTWGKTLVNNKHNSPYHWHCLCSHCYWHFCVNHLGRDCCRLASKLLQASALLQHWLKQYWLNIMNQVLFGICIYSIKKSKSLSETFPTKNLRAPMC